MRHPVLSFARSRATAAGCTALLVVALATGTLASELYPVPFNSRGAVVHGLPLLALAWGLPVAMLIQPASPQIEVGLRRVLVLRCWWAAGLVLVTSALAACLVALSSAGSSAVAARNAAGGVGLVLLAASLIDLRVSWLPLLTLIAVCLLWGVDYRDFTYGWALPLAAGGDPVAASAAVLLAVAGWVVYTVRDARQYEV